MNTMLQVRIDEDLKIQATMVYEQLGIDLSTAVRMFLKKSVAVNGVPFELKNDSSLDKAIAAANSMRARSEEKHNDEMDLDEINAIIKKARSEKK
ncbi:MAG: type II toxin-antitoxin system RelB/DinJ family antitoxin [Bacilli bacterium]|nr:type II toxin-antitoxin system RelB/DinJ family antitoxin [Bacilli bacterium]